MANNDTTASKVRFVRCPKCLKLLAEFSHIPVYRCGSCGMILKAKNNSPLGQNQNQNQILVEESIEKSVGLNDSGKRESLEIERIGVNGGIKGEDVIEDSRVNIGSSEEDCNGGSGGSFSSDYPSNGVPNKYRLMSKRTFRSSSNKDKGSISNSSIARKNNPSFDSEDFHSVQNLTGVNVVDKQPSVKCQKVGTSTEFKSLQFDHVELMKKVDEIRDKVDILIDKTVIKERKLNFRGDRNSKSLQQHVHCINCPPREVQHLCSHHHNACCHHSEEPNSRQHKTERKEDDDAHKYLNLKQKKPANSKAYCLPVQKGAPFVICSECMNVLHLPPDFLVSKKRWHKLQCGACSKILVFTFRARRAHEGSSSAPEGLHPPTEASASNSNVSFTEEYQQFFLDKSYSLETQQFLYAPRNSSEINVERKCSSLHQLMGYDSASELLRLRSYSSDD